MKSQLTMNLEIGNADREAKEIRRLTMYLGDSGGSVDWMYEQRWITGGGAI